MAKEEEREKSMFVGHSYPTEDLFGHREKKKAVRTSVAKSEKFMDKSLLIGVGGRKEGVRSSYVDKSIYSYKNKLPPLPRKRNWNTKRHTAEAEVTEDLFASKKKYPNYLDENRQKSR